MGSHPQFDRTLVLLLLVSAGLFLLAAVALAVREESAPAAARRVESGAIR